MSAGTALSCSPLRATKPAMMATGMAIEMIVRGWRSRRPSDICSASGPPRRSGRGRSSASVVLRRAPDSGLRGSTAGVASMGPDGTVARARCLPSADGPARPGHARPGRSLRAADAGVAAQPIDALGDRRPEPDAVGRPTGHEVAVGQRRRAARPACRRVAIERGVGDADLEHGVRVGHGDAGQPVLPGERRGLLVAVADEPGVVDLDPVDERGQGIQPCALAERATEPVERMRDADHGPLLAGLLDGLVGRQAGRQGRLQERAR